MQIKHKLFFLLLFFSKTLCQNFKWAIIGAGPAGISTVSVLIDKGVNPQDIAWIDPEFNVGRLGKYYSNVPSNQRVGQFIDYMNSCSFFKNIKSDAYEIIKNWDKTKESPKLSFFIEPLKDITDYLKSSVNIFLDTVMDLENNNNFWKLNLGKQNIFSEKVVLAIGAYPKKLIIENIQEIPLDIALDQEKLKENVKPDDKIIVIGDAHSAILILKYLSELPVWVTNIYTKPPRYELPGGLQGVTADWSKNILDNNLAKNIIRVKFKSGLIEETARTSDKIIYAFGYHTSKISINGITSIIECKNNGVILPNLFGIGFAFPEYHITPEGHKIQLVGINSFMRRALELIPVWSTMEFKETNCELLVDKQQEVLLDLENYYEY